MNLAKSFSVYFFSAIIEKGIGFLILPILTGLLLPESIGKLSLIISTYAFLAPFILISTSGAVFVEFHKTQDKEKFATYFSTALLINLFFFLLFSTIVLLGLDWFVEQIGCPKEWVLAIPLFCLFDAIKGTALSIFQVSKKPLFYTGISLAYTIINFSVSILLVYKFGLDYEGRLSGIFISGLVVSLASFLFFFKMKLLSFKISFDFIKDILSYGIPLIPHAVGFLVLDLADRFFINHFAGKSELGIYSISYLLASVVYVLANSFFNGWIPYFYDELKKDTVVADLRIVKISYFYAISMLLICTCFIAGIPFVYHLFINENYYGGIQYCWLIICGYFFMSIYLIFSSIIFYEKKNYIFGYIALLNIFVNLILNYFLIKYYHALGGAIASCISMFIFMMLVIYFSHRIKALPWKAGWKECKLLVRNEGKRLKTKLWE